jgi:hypothetical protein
MLLIILLFFIFNLRWASRFAGALRPLASGYPLHHLRGFHPLGGSAAIPLANRTYGASVLCTQVSSRFARL